MHKTTVQGDFTSNGRAQQAMAGLIQSGIAADHIRMWDIIPDNDAGQAESNVTATGALWRVLGGGNS